MDPADAAELGRRMRAAAVEEIPPRRWVLTVCALLIFAIVALAVALVLS